MKCLHILLLLALASYENVLTARTSPTPRTAPARAAAPAKQAPMETAQEEKAEQAQAQAQAQALAANQLNMEPDFTMQDMAMQQGGDSSGGSDQTPTGKGKHGKRRSY